MIQIKRISIKIISLYGLQLQSFPSDETLKYSQCDKLKCLIRRDIHTRGPFLFV